MKIAELLQGTIPGRVQSSGIMQMIPLLAEGSTPEGIYADPGEIFVSTTTYGNVRVANKSTKTLILPPNSAFFTKKAAQDHATTSAMVVPKQTTKDHSNSLCIQQSQGGYIKEDNYRFSILPANIRSNIYSTLTRNVSFNTAWETISQMNRDTGKNSIGNLVIFFDAFKSQLDNFVAEFEPVPRQVGAIILINGKVAGIERGPAQDYWLNIWEAVIRDCYGSKAIMEARKGDITPPETRVPLREATSIEDLRQALNEAEEQERASVEGFFTNICSEDLNPQAVNWHAPSIPEFEIRVLANRKLAGQAIHNSNGVVYTSLVSVD